MYLVKNLIHYKYNWKFVPQIPRQKHRPPRKFTIWEISKKNQPLKQKNKQI